ncbi:flagellar export protein FliJ [Mixta tenebrionis]|uniref:Flagellar FliJ protein n=1 Tax=Mixta tenebrionis TaxID=2562439 RepID=A0A506UZB1_9GAMM|nr:MULTISPECIES: flagellar export protein FliJ [Mixta]QHM75098.1 Flagellar FliJ protein [Mixta theicola]TPW38699.1 flagella biosynthesis chaperone FliJ [Mixta tenebrionis]
MAKANSAMETLRDLAQKEVEEAAIRLGTMRRAQQQADEQLTMLLNYQDEYRHRLNDNLSSGIASSRWSNYHQFIQTLEQAIEQHRRQLAQCTQKVEQALNAWRHKQQRLHAWETLQARSQASELLQENRLDQKRMDEYAQRASLRKGE